VIDNDVERQTHGATRPFRIARRRLRTPTQLVLRARPLPPRELLRQVRALLSTLRGRRGGAWFSDLPRQPGGT